MVEEFVGVKPWEGRRRRVGIRPDANGPLTGDALLDALFDAWNRGVTGVERALNTGKSPDSISAHHNYGTSALELSKCYPQ
jgi:hypothetical protein